MIRQSGDHTVNKGVGSCVVINCNVVHELPIFYPTIFSLLKEIASKLHRLPRIRRTANNEQLEMKDVATVNST